MENFTKQPRAIAQGQNIGGFKVQDQLNRIEQQVADMHKLLTVDDFGREGLILKQRKNHERITKLEDAHDRIVWLGAAGTGLLALLIAFKDEIKNLLFK